tara:strand:+ start:626 stop:799 length:174 start_codon:yes stop_codon:yes gene_type:complete
MDGLALNIYIIWVLAMIISLRLLHLLHLLHHQYYGVGGTLLIDILIAITVAIATVIH